VGVAGGVDGAVADAWLASYNDSQLDALVRERSPTTPTCGRCRRIEQAAAYARLAGATMYPAVDLLAHGGGKMGGDSSGVSGSACSRTGSWTSGPCTFASGGRKRPV